MNVEWLVIRLGFRITGYVTGYIWVFTFYFTTRVFVGGRRGELRFVARVHSRLGRTSSRLSKNLKIHKI